MPWQNRDHDHDSPPPRREGHGPRRDGRAASGSRPPSARKSTQGRAPTRGGPEDAARPRDASAHGTSWEQSADWYDKIIGAQGSDLYQRIVIPGALQMLGPRRNETILDLGCGQGVFTRAIAETGARVTGLDASASLIQRARRYPSRAASAIRYVTRDAADLHDLGGFDAVSSILALQNMEHLHQVCLSASRVLRDGGRMLWVMNHPCFRIPKQTSWEYDPERNIQYRRVDGYSAPRSIPILMHPGQEQSESTLSFHKSLTDLMSCAFGAGFVLANFEEWHSDKQSQPGPRAQAENQARDEFPLFLAMMWWKPGR